MVILIGVQSSGRVCGATLVEAIFRSPSRSIYLHSEQTTAENFCRTAASTYSLIAPPVHNNIRTAAFRSDDSKALILLFLLLHLALFCFLLLSFCPSGFCRLCRSCFRLGCSGHCLPTFGPDLPEVFLIEFFHSCWVSFPVVRHMQPILMG